MTWAYVLTHPIQYATPVLQCVAGQSEMEALYCSEELEGSHAAAGFGVDFRWDLPLLEGYPFRMMKNRAHSPSTSSFGGLDNPEVSELIASRRYRAVVLNGWHFKTAWRAIIACWRHGIPVLVRSDSHLRSPRSALRQIAKWPVYRSFIPRFDGCLAVGTWSRDYFIHYGARPNHIFSVPHCVDNARFEVQGRGMLERRRELRHKWNLPESAVVFVFAGKLIPKKRPLDFLAALGRSALSGAPVAGLIVGDGPLRASCEEFARSQKLPVSFAGFLNQSQIPGAYAASDVLILPSDGYETWGLVVNEAMASGLPCIVSDQVGCGPDLIEPGITGAVFEIGNVTHLAELMTSLVAAGRVASMGQNAKRLIDGFSVEASARALVDAVETVVGRQK